MLEHEAALAEDGINHRVGVLVAVFGVDALAAGKLHIEIERLQERRLLSEALQINLHARTAAAPQCNMFPGIERKIGAELAV